MALVVSAAAHLLPVLAQPLEEVSAAAATTASCVAATVLLYRGSDARWLSVPKSPDRFGDS